MAISPDGLLIGMVAESKKEAVILNALDGKRVRKLKANNSSIAYSINISQHYIAIGYQVGITLYNRTNYEKIWRLMT